MSVAVIFEVEPDPERFDAYLARAASLAPRLAAIEGFVENERFRSRRRPGHLVSLSLWEDEAAAIRWRENEYHTFVNIRDSMHALALAEGPVRDEGHLSPGVGVMRVRVLRDYGLTDRAEAPHP